MAEPRFGDRRIVECRQFRQCGFRMFGTQERGFLQFRGKRTERTDRFDVFDRRKDLSGGTNRFPDIAGHTVGGAVFIIPDSAIDLGVHQRKQRIVRSRQCEDFLHDGAVFEIKRYFAPVRPDDRLPSENGQRFREKRKIFRITEPDLKTVAFFRIGHSGSGHKNATQKMFPAMRAYKHRRLCKFLKKLPRGKEKPAAIPDQNLFFITFPVYPGAFFFGRGRRQRKHHAPGAGLPRVQEKTAQISMTATGRVRCARDPFFFQLERKIHVYILCI